jgi:hypothetical protein
MPLEWLFGRRKTPEEILRQNKRALERAMRDLDRERANMERNEKKIIADIKKLAKQGQMVCVHVHVEMTAEHQCIVNCRRKLVLRDLSIASSQGSDRHWLLFNMAL